MERQSDPQLEGIVLIFEEPFLLSFFNDPHFLDRFAYLQADRTSPFLRLDEPLNERLRSLLAQMKTEIDDHTEKDQDILRAMLYEALVLLNRAEKTDDGGQLMSDVSTGRVAGRIFCFFDIDRFETCTVKCDPDIIDELKARYNAVDASYNMDPLYWIGIQFNDDMPDKEIKHWVRRSYDIVSKKSKSKL